MFGGGGGLCALINPHYIFLGKRDQLLDRFLDFLNSSEDSIELLCRDREGGQISKISLVKTFSLVKASSSDTEYPEPKWASKKIIKCSGIKGTFDWLMRNGEQKWRWEYQPLISKQV